MEAVPKLPLISFELKVSPENTHFGPKLKQYIAEVYREDPDSYSNEIHQLEGLRSAAVRPSIDAAGLSALTRYFCQLRAMQSRFPMAKGQPAACTFTWKDLYANMSCSLADIRFEMASILYNIGALHTQLGTSEPRTTADSLKSACTHYQNAAWAFQYLREQYPQPPGADASTEIMRLLQEICFAQAQECILEKSIQDTRKPTVIGAVATQVLFFYKNSLALLGPSAGTDNIHEIIGTKLYNYWHRYLSFKSSYIGCIVCLYQGMNAEEQQKMGERVAFYQQAVDKLGETRKLVKYIEPTQVTQEALVFTNDVVEGKRKAAKNENEFIYHEEVPDKDLLMDLKPVCLVKALPINFNDPEVIGLDIFSRLVPMGAHEASSLYSEEKAKLLRRIVGQAEAKTTELTEFMSSLQLDQLDVLASDQNVPQEIVDRCAAMNAKTEIIQALVDSMNNLAEIISDVEHSLAEIKNLIQEETLKEKEYQKVMGPRPPSIVQTELSREYHKYQEAHTRTNESNQVLHKAMTLHIANLRLLSQPLDVLHTKIPSIDNIEGLDRETMAEMKRVVGKAREMQTQRDSLIQQLREAITSDDITSVLLARSSEPADEIFKQELEKHTPKVKIVEQNLAAQENIINRLTSLYASYGESRRLLSDVLRKREGLINALVTSYDTYEELLGKCQKGLEFYKKLSHNVGQLLTRLRSTCQVQEEERAQLLAKQTSKASTATTVAPPAPVGPKPSDVAPSPVIESSTPKLKDYLPYMKNRNLARSVTPQSSHVEPIPSDAYYPESIYPTSVRPTPVGSEATDLSQMKLPDGVVIPPTMQNTNPYNRYGTPYAQCDVDPYTLQNYAYPPSKSFDKPEDPNHAYTAYTPSQYSTQMANTQFANPYYSATHDTTTSVTDSSSVPYGNVSQANMNSSTNTYNVYTDPYNAHSQIGAIPEAVSSISSYGTPNQAELSANFAKMNISAPKSEQPAFGTQYSQTFYSVQYPQTTTPNVAAYSNAGQDLNTTVSSQVSTDYSYSYPYTSDPANQYIQSGFTTNVPISSQHSQPAIDTSGQYVQPNIHDPTQYAQHGSTQIASNANQYIQPYPNTSNTQYSQPIIGSDASSAQYIQPGINVETNLNQQPMITNVSNQYTQPNSNASNGNQYNYPGTDRNVSSANQYVQPGTAVNANQYVQPLDSNVSNPYSVPSQYSYGTSAYDSTPQGYAIYTNADTSMTYSSTSVANAIPTTLSQPYSAHSNEPDKTIGSAALSELDAFDKPIKSHVRGEALPSNVTFQSTFQNYDPNAVNYNPTEQTYPPTSSYPYVDQSANVSYSTYQNHPGYNYNPATGSYDYNYGSQNSYTNYEQTNIDPQAVAKDPNWSVQGVYTSAGTCVTVQSPSEIPQTAPETVLQTATEQTNSNQMYYNNPYGYQTTTVQSNENVPSSEHDTNYGAHMNQSTYMQSGQPRDTSVTYSSNQVSTPKEDVTEQPDFESANNVTNQKITSSEPETQGVLEQKPQLQSVPEVKPTESKVCEPSTFDLLSEIDFTVEQKPLMPEIKVPQISESAIKKPILMPREEPVIKSAPKEEIIERPAKRDIFSDPSLLNKFTEEVKNLQKLVDSLTNKTPSGLTLLDSKWKTFQDVQTKENMNRSKSIAKKHSRKNIVTEVVPYNDSRVTLQSDPDAYINASYYKQLASWCIPLVISANPSEYEYSIFWKAVLENKISCVICLLSEIEMQGKFYWPTAKGQSLELSGGLKVTLDEVTCTVHWTERKLTISSGKTTWNVTHYQINVFPAKIVCSPLVLLVDKILSETYDKRVSNQLRGAWVQCAQGAGRCALLTLLLMLVCQVRAGQLLLCDTLDAGCVNLYKHRTNVLEDTKYLADAYRAALYYVQGVLCSGTTMFNGEAVSVPSGAAILPPVTPTPPPPASSTNQRPAKFTRESFEEMKQSPGLKSGDMKDPLNFLDPLWSLKKK